MAIRVQCPVCGKGLKAGDEHAGSSHPCPKCGELIKIPAPPPPEDWTSQVRAASTARPTSPKLRTCKDCGGQVSKSATKCPHCGARLQTTAGQLAAFGCLAIFCLFGGCVVLATISGNARDAERSAFVADPEMQKKRQDFVNDMIEQGVFTKVEKPGTVPNAWVTSTFYLLSFEDKKSFCSVAYALYFPDPEDTSSGHHLRLKDSRTGKTVGTYSLALGLELE